MSKSEEAIRKLQIVGHNRTTRLANVSVVKNKKEQGYYYRAGQANFL